MMWTWLKGLFKHPPNPTTVLEPGRNFFPSFDFWAYQNRAEKPPKRVKGKGSPVFDAAKPVPDRPGLLGVARAPEDRPPAFIQAAKLFARRSISQRRRRK